MKKHTEIFSEKKVKKNIRKIAEDHDFEKDWFSKNNQSEELFIKETEGYLWYYVTDYSLDIIPKIKQDYINGDKSFSVDECLNVVMQTYEALTGNDISWFTEHVQKLLSRELNTSDKRFQIGECVCHLMYWGSSKNQAIKSIADC